MVEGLKYIHQLSHKMISSNHPPTAQVINKLPLVTIKVNKQDVQRRRVQYRPDSKRPKMRLTAADKHEKDRTRQHIVAISPLVG